MEPPPGAEPGTSPVPRACSFQLSYRGMVPGARIELACPAFKERAGCRQPTPDREPGNGFEPMTFRLQGGRSAS